MPNPTRVEYDFATQWDSVGETNYWSMLVTSLAGRGKQQAEIIGLVQMECWARDMAVYVGSESDIVAAAKTGSQVRTAALPVSSRKVPTSKFESSTSPYRLLSALELLQNYMCAMQI